MIKSDAPRIGMCWYDEEQWRLLKQLDPEGSDDSYEAWRKQANEAFSEFRAAGQNIVKVSINIDELAAWCEEHGLPPGSSSRSEYAAYKLRKRDEADET